MKSFYNRMAALLPIFFLFVAVLQVQTVSAQCSISQPNSDGFAGDSETMFGQTFTPTCNGTITAVTFTSQSAVGTVTALIRTAVCGGTTLFTSVSQNVVSGVNTVTVPSVSVTANTTYFLQLNSQDAYNFEVKLGNPYSGGTFYRTTPSGNLICVNDFPDFDMVFSVTIGPSSCTAPTAYAVTGGGSFCSGGAGVAVGLANSETGVTYQLKNGASNVGSPANGTTGSPIAFGNQTAAGTYTVVATRTVGGCTAAMTGSAVVTVNNLPTAYSVTGGGSFCSGGSGLAVGLANSETGVTYQLKNGASNVGSPANGTTGSPIAFGNQTAAGTYTVVATRTVGGCTAAMTGSAVVTVNNLPTAYSVTGGGSFCSGGSGLAVGLANSETGVTYQLKNGASNVGSPANGTTGSPIAFGNQTAAGTYTVVATRTAGSCTANMTGSAVITVTSAVTPSVSILANPGNSISSGTSVTFTATPINGGTMPTYVWKNGVNVIVGENGSMYTTTDLQNGDIITCEMTSNAVCANPTLARSNAITMTVNTACTTPTAYALTGGGRACDNGVSILLSDSDLGITYQLYKGIITVGDPLEGTGESLDFGENFIEAGIYTVVATRTVGGCTANMTGNATITPCFFGLSTPYCSDDNTSYILTGSEAPIGTFTGPGITDNGDGTATFNPSLAGFGGTVTYTVGNTSNRPDATTGSKSADPGGSTTSISQNVAVYLCGSVPTFTGIDVEYCDLDAPVTLTGSFAPLGFFTGTGITDNGDGTATFDPSAAIGNSEVRYLLNANLNSAWVSISAGYSHSMAIQTDGSLWAWGDNASGQFGNGTNTGSDIPVQIDAAYDWARVSAGTFHTLATKTDGTLWAWGQNTLGVLGNGTNTDSNVPVQIGTDADWASISAGYDHSMAMKTDGTIWTWGDNFLGQLGNGTDGFGTESNAPIQVGADADWASIAAGDFHSLATKTDGSLWAWGQNTSGQLGDGTDTNSNVPKQVGTDTDWNKATGGAKHSLATKTNGTLWAWGNNEYGQIGNGSNTDSSTPVQVGTDTDWVGISACSTSVAIKANGTLWAWGNNEYGQIGNGSTTDSNTPVQVGTDTDWSSADAGASHTMGLKTNGTLQTWGDNAFGQLGNGTTTPSDIPTKVVTAVATTTVAVIVCLDFTGLDDAYCAGAAPVTLTGNHAPDGTFSGPGITDNGDGTASFDPAAAGTGGSITYTYGSPVVTFIKEVTVSPSPTDIVVNNISAANCNNTTCTTDDTYTADVTVTFNTQPLSGTISLTGDDLAWPVPSVDASTLNGNSYTFTGVMLRADGNEIDLTAALNGCENNDDELGAAPSCGATAFTPTNITVAGFGCLGPNGTYTPNGTLNGAPRWDSQYGPGNFRIVWTGSRWEIQVTDQGPPYAWAANTGGSGSITNLPCSGGWTDPLGVDCISTGVVLSGGCGDLSGTPGPSCAITGMSIGNMGTCNDNGTTTAADDYFVSGDVAVAFAYAPSSGNLVIKRGNTVLGTKPASELSCVTEWLFLNVQMSADGQPLDITAEFTGTSCALTQSFGNAPASCSCVPTSAFTTCPSTQSVNVDADKCFATVNYAPEANGTPAPSYAYAFSGASNGGGGGPTLLAEFNAGVTNLKITATNDCGSVECNITVTVTDNQKPVITCPDNRTVNADQDLCSSVQTYNVVTTDNCSASTTQTAGLSSGTAFPVGVTTNGFTAADAAGNTSACAFTVTVVDNQKPVITCPDNRTVNADQDLCSSVQTYNVVTTDNCSASTTQTAGLSSGTAFPVGVTTNGFTAADAAGNTSACAFTVTVVDNQKPVITCPDNRTVNADQDLCSSVQTYNVVTTDNCSASTTQTAGLSSGTAFPVGVTTNGFTAADAAGNTSACMFTVTVVDNQKPVITCPANRTVNADQDLCSSVQTYNVVTTDNCSASTTQTAGLSSGTAFPVGVTTNGFTAADAAGNTSACAFTVTVVDNQKPVITCPDNRTVNADQDLCSSVQTYNVVTTDNCSASTTQTAGLSSGTAFPVGVTTNGFTAADAAGNTSACMFTVTVVDNQKPVITCPANRTVNADQDLCSSVQTYNVVTTDNCSASTTQTAGLSSGTAFPVGITTNGFTATDAAGNTSACMFTVTVVDNQKPVITCPANRTVNADQGQCSSVQSYTVTTTDNCSATTQPTAGLSNGAAFPVGITINAFLATDAAGNTAICSFSIRVIDTQVPVVTCPANTTLGIGDNCSTPLASYGLANKSDNCSTAIFETQSPVAGTIVTGHNTAQTVTLTATDASGNTASCSFVVTLKDVLAPSITCPANIIRPADPSLCSAAVPYAAPIYSDNCSGGGAVHINGGTSGSTFAKGTTIVNWQATDGVGLTKTCSFTVTVNDAQAPTITCPASIVRSNDAGQCSAVVTYPTPKAADNCGLPAGQPQWVSGGTTPTASGANSVSTFQKGLNIVTWRATDGAGLTKTCTFRVTVNDTEAPTLTCPAAMSLTTAPNTCSSAAATYTNPTFTDNCALTNSTATRINGLVSGSTFPLGNNNVVFQATDAAGNTRRCTMVVTVTDNQPPVITCPASVAATGTGTPCRATAFYGSTTASDNCAGTLTPFLVTGLASGSQYPAGVTTNTFRAVAPNGQSSECSFTVTVDCGSGMGNNGVEVRNADLNMQHGDKLELKLTPNPALSTVTVSIEGVGANGGTLLVFDAVGRLILRQVVAENQRTAVFQVEGSEFAPGMYRVNLRTETGMVTKTLVVVK